jgi:hypothetical protein
MKSDVKKPKKRKDTEVKPENWLAYQGVFYKVNTIVCVNNDPHFGG